MTPWQCDNCGAEHDMAVERPTHIGAKGKVTWRWCAVCAPPPADSLEVAALVAMLVGPAPKMPDWAQRLSEAAISRVGGSPGFDSELSASA